VEGIAGFVLAGFALAGSPGPATLSLAATGAAFGARRGLGYLSGVVAGLLVVIAATASGVTGILFALPGATPVFTVAAGAYFIYLAYRIATAPPLSAESGEGRQPRFLGGVFL
jgi:threonine/homoserine/homoserine lactone efflux protein